MAIHTVSIRFTDKPEDQALYQTLLSTGEAEYRPSPTRQAKHLLKMALGHRLPDPELLRRMGFPVVTTEDILCNLETRVAHLQQEVGLELQAVKKATRPHLTVLKGGRHDTPSPDAPNREGT